MVDNAGPDAGGEDAGPEPRPGSVRDMLAANLRRARTERGLSLSELSRRSRIGKATLSQLESGSGNPTIETVFSLSRALEVAISDLLDHGRPSGPTVVRAADVEVLRGAGVDLRPLRGIEAGDAIFEVYDQVVRAGARQDSLGHAGTEHTIVQAGRLGVRVDDRYLELGPGDYVGFDAARPHSYTALDGQVRSVLLLQYRSDQRLRSSTSGAACLAGTAGRER
ncbi:XRE family transcriptional regulator [Actinomadura sp. NBRC 104412]|uniref:XRE family transcriptional regulator n=1 Tax=Actinomadura sp. NBRC 104412 TaxID=3032203 RepID=UPI0024A36DFA|nr:XRE family transcriptional regulator [Actinomadura sp. NBRC 104412]GLZ03212.1 XRE family transcriptional regulator [Actinomadura sp. NBRC 104412]